MIIRDITAPNPGAFTLSGTRTYLLGESAVIDPGPAIDSHIEAIRKAMPRLTTILITHRHGDHAPAAVPLKRMTGARILAPRGVLDDTLVDQRVANGEWIAIEDETLEVIATPGHTAEHVCFLTSAGDLFTGDTVLGEGTTAIFPPDGSMRDYIASLRVLLTHNPKRIFPAHGPTRDDAATLIEQYIAHRLERENQVLDALVNGATSAATMRQRIYPDLDPRLHGAAEIQIAAHLIKLVEDGRVVETGSGALGGGEWEVGTQQTTIESLPHPPLLPTPIQSPAMTHKDFIEIHDYSADEVRQIFEIARDMKANPEKYRDALNGKTLAMIFEKSSTRTRVSFEVGMFQMGGHALFLSSRDIQIGRGEPIYDSAKVLSRYVDGIMARTFAHKTVTELAEYASVPVINGLTELSHPMQAMTDYFTAWEHLGELKGRKLAYIGDGNNMAHSLMFGASKVGMNISVATPPSYAPDPMVIAQSQGDADYAGTKVTITTSIDEAVRDADVVETDVWASMGQEAEAQKRQKDFEGWMVDARVMSLAKKDAIFMHCLPAHRGEEVAGEVIDSPQSVIYDEAENRLHVQKAIMYVLMRK